MQTYQSGSVDHFQSIDFSIENAKTLLQSLIQQENWTEAHREVSAQSLDKIYDPDYLMMCAEVYSKASDFPASLKIFHNLLDIVSDKDPKIFEIYKNMGNIYLKCGDIDAAEEKYNLANAINNQDENLIINYGVLAIQKGQYQEAKQRFASVLQDNNQSDLAWVGLGLVHRAHADHELARACLLRGLDENPYNKLAITNYYQWCTQDGIDASDQFLNDFLEKFPQDAEISKLANGLNQ